jgi:flavorubredoxin
MRDPLITEIAPDLFRISTYVPQAGIQFNYFVSRDREPLLFHAGQRQLFPLVKEAVSRILDPATIRWIGFSHFESDECGALNEWLALAPAATAICSVVGAIVSVNDFSSRLPRPMADGEVLETGQHRFRFLQTPQVPHAWDAGLLFEETSAALLCSDLFHQMGDVEDMTSSDVVGRARDTLVGYNAGPFARYMPYTPQTEPTLGALAELRPRILATMHGSTYEGNGEQALRDLAVMMREVLG